MEKIYKELDFLDEKMKNINIEMVTLEKEKNETEEKKANLISSIKELEEEKKNILEKTDKCKGIQKYLYVIMKSSTDLKNLKIINSKLEENRINLQNVDNKLEIKSKLIKDKMQEKVNIWNRREEIYFGKFKEQKNEKTQDNKKQQENENQMKQEDYEWLLQLYNTISQFQTTNNDTIKIKEELFKTFLINTEKYLNKNSTFKLPRKSKEKNNEEENEC